jgi:hypothetical protein
VSDGEVVLWGELRRREFIATDERRIEHGWEALKDHEGRGAGVRPEKMPVLAKKIALAKPKLRGDERCDAQNVTIETELAMRQLGA